MSDSSDRSSSGWNWSAIGGIAGVFSVIVAIVTLLIQTPSTATNTVNQPPSVQVSAPPVPTFSQDPKASPSPSKKLQSSVPPLPSQNDATGTQSDLSTNYGKIVYFKTLPGHKDRLIGNNKFKAFDRDNLGMTFQWDVRGADDTDISECAITGVVLFLDGTDRREDLRGVAECPSESTYLVTKSFLKVGNYKLVSTAYVPATGQKVTDEYSFSIVA